MKCQRVRLFSGSSKVAEKSEEKKSLPIISVPPVEVVRADVLDNSYVLIVKLLDGEAERIADLAAERVMNMFGPMYYNLVREIRRTSGSESPPKNADD